MNTLTITDLPRAAELDDAALAAVRGGCWGGYRLPVDCSPSWPKPGYGKAGDIDFNASQMLSQSQNTTVNNGNNIAFAHGISANVNPSQHGANTINFG
ncbi:hypothetical protein [Noviherbaspirillum aridicola]|uniref:Uncharacterized protein n=1 Tax=Noviherbaspirillum aridicola TaxID=2849687 RepID=A0ABQ4Q9D6_9BURK|nr:hypothetical protein [Noviherbaspirillum aridicola]GIZ53687.1 hypothetical protein NCCP691_37010 [Noviherbaspirillum aridicola]